MMFRHSTCVVCGAIPPSLGFEEKPAEEQGPPDPPSAAELKRLLAMSERPDPYCPRCQHRMALHLGRVMAGGGPPRGGAGTHTAPPPQGARAAGVHNPRPPRPPRPPPPRRPRGGPAPPQGA